METNSKNRKLKGTVASDKMNLTAVVEVKSLKKHPKYKKFYKVSRRFKAHNPENKFHIGDEVIMTETRPMSKEKRWIITELVKGAVKVQE
jgi:small subunit ribosomal protein S17